MTCRLWLVRHGATDWSDAGRLNGRTDVPLNARGKDQALALAEPLADRGFAGVWSSDLSRASDTALLAVGDPTPDPRLRELDFGSLEGKRWEECPPEIRGPMIAFEGFCAPGGESVATLKARVFEFVDALPRGDHVVFTHGGVIRLFLREEGMDRGVRTGELVRWPGPTRTSGR